MQLTANIEWSIIGKLPNGAIQTQLKQTLPKGWHTYWKNPGDSGAKASIKAQTPGIEFGNLEFPKPTIIPVDPFITYGYKNKVTYQLPIIIHQPTNKIRAIFEWLECEEVCIPKETNLQLTIPNKIPQMPALSNPQPTIQVTKKGAWIQFELPQGSTKAAFFPYKNNQFNMNEIQFNKNLLRIKLSDKTIQNIEGELFIDDERPIIITTQAIIKKSPIIQFILTLVGAFIGGLLLNIMPCVLPILGIKAIQIQQTPNTNKVKDALAYFLGISLSLFSLYLILLGIKLTGTAIGWGFQLQSPIMIQSLILLFIAIMTINLDLIQIPLPKFASKSSNNMVLNGILTTIIATPCTAPFLGSALSVALFKSPLLGTLIFLCISLGLALPMALLIISPSLQRRLPKSGQWNNRIKFYLNFGFVLTIGWLMWVLSSQISTTALMAFFSSIITLFCLILIRSKAPMKQPLIIIISTALIGYAPLLLSNNQNTVWLNYTPTLAQQFEQTNTPYFIDVTAKWCITCQTNKITVLNKKESHQLFKSKNIQLIQADWTNKSATITYLLEKHNQISIPTYIYYDGSKHHVFGDILTPQKLKEHIK